MGSGLDRLGQSVAQSHQTVLAGVAEAVVHLSEQLSQQGQVVASLGQAVAEAAAAVQEAREAAQEAKEAATKPKHIELHRGKKGELVGATARTSDEDED